MHKEASISVSLIQAGVKPPLRVATAFFCTYWLFSRMAETLNFVSLKHASLFLYLLYQPFFVPTFLSYFFFVPTCTSLFLYLLAVQPYGEDFKLCKFKTRQPFFVPTVPAFFCTYFFVLLFFVPTCTSLFLYLLAVSAIWRGI